MGFPRCPGSCATGTDTSKCQIHGILSLQALLSVEACGLVAVAPGHCAVDVVMGARCRIAVVGSQVNFNYPRKKETTEGSERKGG